MSELAVEPEVRDVSGAYRRPPPDAARSRSSDRGGGVVAILTIVALAVGGFTGWYYFQNRTNPKDQAIKYLVALKTVDYKTLYETMEMPTGAHIHSEAEFERQAKQATLMGHGIEQARAFTAMFDFAVGEPKVDGAVATIPVSIKARGIQILDHDIKMKNFGGVWKYSKDNWLIKLDFQRGSKRSRLGRRVKRVFGDSQPSPGGDDTSGNGGAKREDDD